MSYLTTRLAVNLLLRPNSHSRVPELDHYQFNVAL